MFGLFSKKAKKAVVALNKAEHTAMAKAIIAGGVLVAAADGNIEDSELEALRSVIQNNSTLKAFVPEASDWTNEFVTLIKSSPRTAKLEIMRVVEQVRTDRGDAENVLVAVLDIADANGSVDDAEQEVLNKVATTLGLRLADYI